MNQMWMDFREFYWTYREMFRMAGIGLAFLCAQTVVLVWTLRRLSELSHIRERMSRLADGLALLTDTTEAGMATLAQQIDQANRKARAAKPAAARTAVQKRVKEAVRRGERVSKIAAHEALSESEVRLHLALTKERRQIDANNAGDVEHAPLMAS